MFKPCPSSRGARDSAAFSPLRTALLVARTALVQTALVQTALLVLMLLLVSIPPLSAQNETPERAGGIVAVVGDTVITQSELDRTIAYRRYQTPSDYPQPLLDWHRLQRQHAVLEGLIDEKLILHRVQIIEKKEGQPYITEFHIDKELEARVNRLKKEGTVAQSVEDIYRAFRENYGMSRKDARQFLRDQMSMEKFMWREVYHNRVEPWVSPEESRYYYRSNIEKFTTPVEISLRQVVIFRTRPEFQAAVEGMEQGLREGVDFVELARMYSQEVLEGLADQAGRVRTYSFEELTSWHDPLPQELRRMKRGEVSGRIVSPVGIHFFKVEDVISGAPEPFSEAHPKIQTLLVSERRRIVREKFLAEERRKTRVEIFLPPLPDKVERPSAAKGGLGGEIPEAGDK